MTNARIGVVFLSATLALTACSGCGDKKNERDDQTHAATETDGEYTVTTEDKEGLQFTLREAKETPDKLVRPRTVEGTPLGEAETKRLLGRLPALPAEEDAQEEFAFRKRSQPPPRTGETVKTAFPPEVEGGEVPEAQKGPLKVLRYAPEGNVDLAPKLSLTFSKPMVAVSGQEDAAETVPASIEPAVEGKWRWIGTRTALFEPEGERFPMATDYTVTVPKSLESATGDKLGEATTFTFSTPPLDITRVYPSHGPHVRDPLMFLEFNQRVNPEELLEYVTIKAGGSSYAPKLATDEQIKQDDAVSRLVEGARPNQWIAFYASELLPAASSVQIGIAKGAPSAEGPKVTKKAQFESSHTYEPLQVRRQSCTGRHKCPPMSGWWITFNNQLDEEAFSADMVTVEPELPNMDVKASYSSINIHGQSEPRTTYKVTLDASLKDRFGQTLGKDTTIEMEVGPAVPRLGSSAGLLTVLDPAAKGKFPIFSVNFGRIHVQAYEVEPEHWSDYLQFVNDRRRTDKATAPGKKVFDKKFELDAEEDEFAQTLIDLDEAWGEDGKGQLVLVVEPIKPFFTFNDRHYRNNDVITWVQNTDIAVDAFITNDRMLTWTSALADGEPLEGVEVSLLNGGATKTDKDGLADIDLTKLSGDQKLARGNVLVAKKGDDVAILPEYMSPWARGQSNWRRHKQSPDMLWHVFDDRGMYKPGETLHLKGWLRKAQKNRKDRLAMAGVEQVQYEAYGPRGNKIATGTADVNSAGGFDFEVDLPDDVNLGYARIQLRATGGDVSGATSHGFQIQEFRRPEFEVSVEAPAGPHVIGQSTQITVDADYYAGGGLSGAPVKWTVQTREGHYAPPNHDDYVFGKWTPWWMGSIGLNGFGGGSSAETFSGHTDASGEHHLEISFDAATPPLPTVVAPSAAVTDVNRQTWSASADLLVHPSKAYVGIRSEKNFVDKGDPIEIESIVTDIDGKILADRPVEISAARIDWQYKGGQWSEVEKDKKTCKISSKDDPQTCKFEPEKGGSWRITAITKDAKGRPNMSQMRVWVAGGETPPNRRAELQEVELIPDKETYEAGDTAKLLIQAPFADAEALMTVRQNGIVTEERFDIDGRSHTVEISISEADYPNVHVQVDLVGADYRRNKQGEPQKDAPKRPAFASGSLDLKVPPKKRVLSVDVTPAAKEVAPGTKTKISVAVTDADGKPAKGAEVALIAVDEAILALSGYQLSDPISSFYRQQSAGVQDRYMRSYLLLATIQEAIAGGADDGVMMDEMAEAEEAGATRSMAMQAAPAAAAPMEEKAAFGRGVGGSAGPAKPKPIALRKDFRALALFAPEVKTGADGKATVDLKLPDNLTRYRLMAVAVEGDDHFGKGESNLTARLPLMVRPSPPRFLNWGDRIEMPVVIQNQTDEPKQVNVAVRAANLRFGEVTGKTFEVPAKDRVEVRFPAVTEEAGEAIVQVAASTGNWADAAQKRLPVWTPATTEAFATYGTVDEGFVTQPVRAPSDAIELFGGLEVTTSSTAVQELTDAVLYLFEYPFECSEQLASRVMGIAALKDVLEAFDAEGLPEKEEMVAAVERDIRKLGQLQRSDGGFYLWSTRDHYRFPFAEVHVAHALQRAKMKGFEVSDEMLGKAHKFLNNVERYIPPTYSEITRNAVKAYAYYVLDVMGESAHKQARALAKKDPEEQLSMEAIGWLMATLADEPKAQSRIGEFERFLQNRVSETAATAQFTTSYGGQEHVLMHSSRRTDAILLDATMATEPKSDLIPKLVRGLLDHRTRGRWLNTQENVFVLLALDRYFQTYEKQTPNFVARMWLGDNYAGEHTYKGRTTDYKQVDIPMGTVVDVAGEEPANLTLQKDGKGRMYYRIGMKYAPKSLDLEPADYGFAVERRYEAVDDPDDVKQREDGTWVIKPGARVRIVLSMVAPARRYHVALVDPLPAGLEPLNPALAVTEVIPERQNEPQQQRGAYWWWFRPWYSHQNLRDERAEAFSPLVWAGVHEYTYVARATTPGEYVVPPTKAEEMYHPETFGRTGTDKVIVE
ncbi:Ig-like domain-containing alpha-2-macroglobulin family protein [Persicimonas caeni]|nr:Ig-like domain-containing alpha-2-macroglobulin family protein [Persicimonas caeni]